MGISTSDGRYVEDEFDLMKSTSPTTRITIRPPDVNPQIRSEEKPSAQDLGTQEQFMENFPPFSDQDIEQSMQRFQQRGLVPGPGDMRVPVPLERRAHGGPEPTMITAKDYEEPTSLDRDINRSARIEQGVRDGTMNYYSPAEEDTIIRLQTEPYTDAFEAAAERTRARYPKREAKPQTMSEYLKSTATPENERYQTWPEKIVRHVVKAVAHNMAVIRGEKDALSDETIAATTEIAGAVIFGPMPIARKAIDGTLGSIAGITAQGANKAKLAEAIKMKYPTRDDPQGPFTTEEIWRKTGWYEGPEGKWKHEIPGSTEANLNHTKLKDAWVGRINKDPVMKLHEVLNYPELYKAYPELKNTTVKLKDTEGVLSGTLDDWVDKNWTSIVLDPIASTDLKNTLLHEIQHWIQEREGFDLGSNWNAALGKATASLSDKARNRPLSEYVEYLNLINTLEKDPNRWGQRLYERTPGEIESRIVGGIRPQMDEPSKLLHSPVGTQKTLEEMGYFPPEIRYPGEPGYNEYLQIKEAEESLGKLREQYNKMNKSGSE